MRARESRRLASPAPRWLRPGLRKQWEGGGGREPREVGEEAGEGGGGDAGD